MTLDERIERQPGSHIVRVPKSQIQALKRERDKAIAERDAYWLKAQAWDRQERQKSRRRQADRFARAIANNPKPPARSRQTTAGRTGCDEHLRL